MREGCPVRDNTGNMAGDGTFGEVATGHGEGTVVCSESCKYQLPVLT